MGFQLVPCPFFHGQSCYSFALIDPSLTSIHSLPLSTHLQSSISTVWITYDLNLVIHHSFVQFKFIITFVGPYFSTVFHIHVLNLLVCICTAVHFDACELYLKYSSNEALYLDLNFASDLISNGDVQLVGIDINSVVEILERLEFVFLTASKKFM